ncbi:MAG: serine/threonine protein kinase [Deltaproteobacteria bacterium]|nr:serine/threonine protein kinase [Deltaproteobacteria bacterium]
MAAEKHISSFKILEEIGSGGMAVVYKAEQPSLSRLVAIKELRNSLTSDKSISKRFEREAKSVAQLAHQNIVHIYDFISRALSMYIVMEYVDGIDLYALLTKVERLPPDIAGIIALQAARALEYAHFRGVVHRDFKPSNLMITKQGDVKLMDFGIARDESFDDLTRPGTALGTPAYMSPEQIMGQKVDHRSDIFSFGIVLYQMLTGQKPFIEDDTKSVMQRILTEAYIPPRRLYPDVPWSLNRILRKCLEKRPDKRYRTTELLRRDLESFVAKKVRINYNGRLLIYLRHRDLINDSEATTYVPKEEIETQGAATDTGGIDSRSAVLKPLFTFNSILLIIFALYAFSISHFNIGSGFAKLQINAVPWAEVYIDGRLHDTTPFAEPIMLPAGQHVIEFRNTYYPTEKRIIELQSGETKQLNITLKKRRRP